MTSYPSLVMFNFLDIWPLFKEEQMRFGERGDHHLLDLVNHPFAILYSWKPLKLSLAFVLYRVDGAIITLLKFAFFDVI